MIIIHDGPYKGEDTDAEFWSEYLKEEPEFLLDFEEEELSEEQRKAIEIYKPVGSSMRELLAAREGRPIGVTTISKIGTASSGHWGHAGRPGLIGGSAPGEGDSEEIRLSNRIDKFETGHVTTASPFVGSRENLNDVFLAKIQGDGKGVLKCEAFEQAPDNGEMVEFYNSAREKTYTDLERCSMVRREVLASKVDKILGVGLVPTTVLKDIDSLPIDDSMYGGEIRGPSSCQFYVEGYKALYKFGRYKERDIIDNNKERIKTAAAFDYLIGSADRHAANVGVDRKDNIVLIDNGFSFTRVAKGAWNGNLADCALVRERVYDWDGYYDEQRRLGQLAIDKKSDIRSAFDEFGLPKGEQTAFWKRAKDMSKGYAPERGGRATARDIFEFIFGRPRHGMPSN